jgi:hypothetical protein
MPEKLRGRERTLILLVGVLILGAAYIVLMSVGIIQTDQNASFYADEIQADAVVLRHEAAAGNNSVVYSMIMLTAPRTVEELVGIRNAALIRSSRKSNSRDRYALFFYKDDRLVEEWRVDKEGYTTFSTRSGSYVLVGDIDIEYIASLVET